MSCSKLPGSRSQLCHRRGFTLIELVLVIGVIAIILSLLLPAMQHARDSARTVQCRNNLMQLGTAMYSYEMSTGLYPPGTVNDTSPIYNEPEGYHLNWAVQLLPALEQQLQFQTLNMQEGLYSSANAVLTGTHLAVLHCPINDGGHDGGVHVSSYAACTGSADAPITDFNNGVFYLNSSTTAAEIRDGSSNTIMVGERLPDSVPAGVELGWASGTAATLRNTGIPLNSRDGNSEFPDGSGNRVGGFHGTGGFGSTHEGGAMFLLADGAVLFLSERIDPQLFADFGSRDQTLTPSPSADPGF